MLTQAPPNKQEIEAHVLEEIGHVLAEKPVTADHPRPVPSLSQRLGPDLGLTSLELAQLVFALETRLAADPFQELVPITSVRTVADLCQAYQQFFAGERRDDDEAAALLESKRRAEARSHRIP
jgi:acyl carrier protein